MSHDVALSDLKPHPKNYNRHDDSQIRRLGESLQRFGQPKEIVIWQGWIIAGHGLVEAARRIGWSTLRASDMSQVWSEAQALAFMAADNELARLGDPDEAALAQLVAGLGDVDAQLAALAAGTEERLKELLATLKEPPGEDPGAQIDKAEELREKWGVETGQLWQLGEHRLICGDCTDRAVVERVMGGAKADLLLSDPPYGKLKVFNATGAVGNAGSNLAKVRNYGAYHDHETFQIGPMLKAIEGLYNKTIIWGGNNFTDILPITQSWLVWDKRAGKQLFYADCEMAWSDLGITAKVFDFVWQGMIREGDPVDRMHPTQKPVELYEWCLSLADKAVTVLDPTLGSASSLIACERLGRRCRAVEIEPGYVAVALERWAVMTGKTPVLLKESE